MRIIHPRWYRPTPLAHGLCGCIRFCQLIGEIITYFWLIMSFYTSHNCLLEFFHSLKDKIQSGLLLSKLQGLYFPVAQKWFSDIIATHCGLVIPYGVRHSGQHGSVNVGITLTYDDLSIGSLGTNNEIWIKTPNLCFQKTYLRNGGHFAVPASS